MVKKYLLVIMLAAASLSALAESSVQQNAGIRYKLTTAMAVANALKAAAEPAVSPAAPVVNFQRKRRANPSAFRLVASFKGSYQFGRSGKHHASEAERVGWESDDSVEIKLPGFDKVLIEGLRVGARLNF